MCRFLISAALSIVMLAACIYLATLTTQPGATAASPDTVDPNAAQLRPDAVARLRQQMELRIAPFQPVAAKFVTDRLAKHLSKNNATKPLVLSFHGCEECGQSMILEVLGQSLWDAKHRAQCVHNVDVNMLDNLNETQHTKVIVDDVVKTLRQCPRAILYFDEIDLMLPVQHEIIARIMEGKAIQSSAISASLATFIFLSGAGAQTLLQASLKKNFARDGVSLGIAQDTLIKLFQPGTDFWNHANADKINWPKVALRLERKYLSLVPFFPLRRVDVRSCLRGEVLQSLQTLQEHKLISGSSFDEKIFDWLLNLYPHAFMERPPHLTKKGCKGATELVGKHIYGGVQEIMKSRQSTGVNPYADKHLYLATPPPVADGDDPEEGDGQIATVALFDGAPPRSAKELNKELARQHRVMMREFKRSRAQARVQNEVREDGTVIQRGESGEPAHPQTAANKHPQRTEL